jgi:cytochrome c-type biogenesis protein
MTPGGLVLSFVAGVLSILSPCVLPLLPIVLGAAASEQKWGPVALAAGLSTSFVAIGLFVATIGFSIGLDADVFRYVAAVFIIAIGVVLMVPRLQTGLAVAGGPMANWAHQRLGGLNLGGLNSGGRNSGGVAGQFGVGVLLGAVWSPCVGPTLGAASLLAAQGRDLGQVAVTMFVFGLGAALPLLALGLVSREAMMRWRHRLAAAGHGLKAALGTILVAMGALVITGLDKAVETALVEASPQWLTDLTTRF